MPIYEFYCDGCNTIYNFFSKTINTTANPDCPRCKRRALKRQVSLFAATGRAKEGGEGGADDLPIDEAKMEKAVESLAGEAEGMNEEDPRQAAKLMRKFSSMTGMEMGPGMQEAIKRMEAGEDPEKVEAELGPRIEQEEPFILPGQKGKPAAGRLRPAPRRDPTLYELKANSY